MKTPGKEYYENYMSLLLQIFYITIPAEIRRLRSANLLVSAHYASCPPYTLEAKCVL